MRRLLLIVTVLIAGCGGGGKMARVATPTPTPAPAEGAKPAPGKVAIKGFAFKPAKLQVKAGTKVTWTDMDASNHTVTFSKGPGDLGNVDKGKTVSATFANLGTYAYVCQYHPNMTGSIVVAPG